MSVIQKIRDKYARWAVIAIAVSLLGFILMDAFAGRTGLFSSKQSTTIGKVNGKTIDVKDFTSKVQAEELAESRQGYEMNDQRRQQLIEGMWDQEVNNVVLTEQYEKLGLTVGEKEMRDILYGSNPPDFIKQAFTDPKTGNFDGVRAQQEVNRILKSGSQDQKDQLNQTFEYIRTQRLMSKYMTLMANTIYFPKWFLEKKNVDNSLMAKASYVSVPYATIPDSTVKVTDSEIEEYIKQHKNDFEQKEETRSISYVSFSAAPSSADTAAARSQVESLKPGFTAAADAATYLNQQGSTTPYFDGYLSKSAIQVPAKDSILALPKGGVYGPYLDANSFVLAKMIDSKPLPDSVKVRHILLGTVNPQTGQPLMPDSVAKAKADSIAGAIRNGANFDTLETKYSTDQAAHQTKGVMTFSSTQIQSENFAKEFGQFILFDGKTGDKKVVKTQFGWHYIEILDQKNVEPHYKIAYLAKPIAASNETDNQANNQASMFAGNSRDLKAFNDNYEKNLKAKGYNKLVASDIRPMDFGIQGLNGGARSFVKKIFDADKGDVIGPERVGDDYVVAIVTEVNKPGLQSVSRVRPMIEPILKNKKKGEQIIKNLGQVTTLEQVSAKINQPIQNADSLRFSGGSSVLGYEPKVLGAIFNPANKGKVTPALSGTQGVYVVRVENVSTTPVEAASIDEQRKMMEMQARQGLMSQLQQGYNPIVEALKKSATIKDNRANFY
jgi:peptidyl-prolyl cis-trans isomerase D